MKTLNLCLAIVTMGIISCSEYPSTDPTLRTDRTDQDVALFATPNSSVDVTDRYIVVFKNSVADPVKLTDDLAENFGAKIHFRYHAALKGFAATLSAKAVESLRKNPDVDFVEADGIASVNTVQTNPPSWGLDRIDQHPVSLDNQYIYQNAGAGVTVYIIDTGIRFDHQEYNGRATSGWDFIDNDANASDCHGHGTHVAGTVGGTSVGIAKSVQLVAVRVLNCSGSGTWSQVIAGIDWVTANHANPSVANMSLGGSYSAAVNTAVNNSVASGVVYAVAAGNSNAVTCNFSPASAAYAITVGATTISDARASFSNYGSCVDIFAPGSSIYSSTMTSTNTYASWSGTSMASPHVAGVAALYRSAYPNASVTAVMNAIVSGATSGALSAIGTGSPNLLLYSQLSGGATPPNAPSSLSCSAVSASQINLSWTDNATDETGSKIERSTNSGASWTQIATVGANVTTFSNTGLAPATTYMYRVRAYNSAGNSSYSNSASATTNSETMHVGVVSGSTQKRGSTWMGRITTTIHKASHQVLSGVTVYVTWSGGANGSGSAVTNSSGVCTISTPNLGSGVSSITMTVVGLSKTGYTASANDVTPSVTLTKP